jgi:ribosome-binding factor A
MSGRRSPEKGPTQRQLRAGELIRHALVEILQREDLRNPALSGVSVTISEVKTSPDLKVATVFATPLGGGHIDDVIAALNRSAPHVRGMLARRIEMKFTPTLKFVADSSFEKARRIDEILARPEVARDLGRDDSD